MWSHGQLVTRSGSGSRRARPSGRGGGCQSEHTISISTACRVTGSSRGSSRQPVGPPLDRRAHGRAALQQDCPDAETRWQRRRLDRRGARGHGRARRPGRSADRFRHDPAERRLGDLAGRPDGVDLRSGLARERARRSARPRQSPRSDPQLRRWGRRRSRLPERPRPAPDAFSITGRRGLAGQRRSTAPHGAA